MKEAWYRALTQNSALLPESCLNGRNEGSLVQGIDTPPNQEYFNDANRVEMKEAWYRALTQILIYIIRSSSVA